MNCDGDDDDEGETVRITNSNSNSQPDSSFLPPSLDSDSIADTIKSFFPTAAGVNSSAIEFQSFDRQDLRLSLHSLHDPILLHHHHNPPPPPPPHRNPNSELDQSQILLTGTPLGFDGNSIWPFELNSHHHHHQQSELSRFHPWNSAGDGGGITSAASDYFLNPPPPPPPQFLSQRGPLQSSNTPSIRAWIDPSTIADHHIPHPLPSMSAIGFSGGSFPGFHIPARIQGDLEEHDAYSEKPSSASSDSRH